MEKVRCLELGELDEIIAEVNRLESSGYQQLGNWDLSQVCGHLEDWIRFPVEGFPKAVFPINLLLWGLKTFRGKQLLQKIISEKRMKAGAPTMPQTVKSFGAKTAETAIADLTEAVDQFKNHSGEYLPSPLFGQMSRKEAEQLQLVHASHHLGFLVPQES